MRYGILSWLKPHGLLRFFFLLFFLSFALSLRGTTIIYVICGLISQSILPVTEVYDYTSAPRRRGILDMSRGAKSKAVFGEKGSSPQDEPGSGEMKIADLFRILNSRFDEQEKRFKEMDGHFKAFQEGKSGELEGIATGAGKRIITPPEPQREQPLLPSQPPRLLPQPPMMPQSSMSQPPPPPSQPPPLQYYQSSLHQSRHLPSSPFLAGRQ